MGEVEMMVEIEWEDGSLYRTPETWYEEDGYIPPVGNWLFADYEKSIDCPGYGYTEMLAQDDDHSGVWFKYRGDEIRVAAWRKDGVSHTD